jgi:hypothetical protein
MMHLVLKCFRLYFILEYDKSKPFSSNPSPQSLEGRLTPFPYDSNLLIAGLEQVA